MPERVQNAEEYLGTAPEGRRESMVTTVIGGKPEYVARIPHPTYVPLLAALSTSAVFVGVLTEAYSISLAGVALLLAVAAVWLWAPDPEKASKDAGRGLRLPIDLGDHRSSGWLGAMMFVFVDASVFISLVYSYFYLWTSADIWPPRGTSPPIGAAAVACAVLIGLTLLAALLAFAGARRGARGLAVAGLLGGILLSAGLLYAESLEYAALPFSPRSDAYAGVVAALGTYHAVHVALALVAALFALARLARRGLSIERSLSVRVAALMTGYTAVQGLVVFAVIYLSAL